MITIELPWPPRELSPNSRAHYMAKHRATKRARAHAYGLVLVSGFRRNDPDIPDALGVDDANFRLQAPQFGDPRKGGAVLIEISAA